ncbi:MAG: aspartate kinase [Planctomycetota bacterium]|nr:aspartate kinase [Planctomycetota bacterium]
MGIIVQKFGGTSVADSEKILAAARKAVSTQQQGNQVVMVVSAMGKNTDMLVDLAQQINSRPPAREMDMLLSTGEQVSVALMAMAIHSLGSEAVSLTGAQIGIRTDSSHTRARIQSIPTDRMRQLLDENKIVIAAGFQGIDENFNITTLGRGGSDLTAVALAAVLKADACEIYTDVDGVYTTDPRILTDARKVSQISYDEMLELASLGAGVLHSRSVEFAKRYGVTIHVRHSFSEAPGSLVVAESESPTHAVGGAAVTKNESLLSIKDIPDQPGTSYTIFEKIANENITVDMIVQNIGLDGKANISFTVLDEDLAVTQDVVLKALDQLGSGHLECRQDVSKVSVVGLGMALQTGVADHMFRTLAAAGINIYMITTSEIKISVLVDRERAQESLGLVHNAFSLQTPPIDARTKIIGDATESDVRDVTSDLVGMEGLRVDDVLLDESQGRITISQIPDRPGVAAHVFENIAAENIFVDMIVQSDGSDGQASLSFTVPRNQLDAASRVAESLVKDMDGAVASSSLEVAKLSIAGIGMRSHTGVAIRSFQSLADEGINVEMVNTSEVRVNLVIDGSAAAQGLEALSQAFADVLLKKPTGSIAP